MVVVAVAASLACLHRQHVHLRQRVGDAEVLLEEIEDLLADLEGEVPLALLPVRGVHAAGDARLRHSLDKVHVTDNKRAEVRRHDAALVEGDGLPAGEFLARRGGRHRHVGHRRHRLRDGEREGEGSLERGLVPAGEGAPGVRCLELSRCHLLLLAALRARKHKSNLSETSLQRIRSGFCIKNEELCIKHDEL